MDHVTNAGVQKALVVGGGIGGMACAIRLREIGIEVDVVEIDPKWRVYGAGITISPATMRSFVLLGLFKAFKEHGFCNDGTDIYNRSGELLGKHPTPKLAGPDYPSAGGIMRPVLREIMSELTLTKGARVELGVSIQSLHDDGQRVAVTLSNGRAGDYDLVVGADGQGSSLRKFLFPQAPTPRFTGQGCWRALVPRPSEIVRPQIYMGIHDKAGVVPVSDTSMYLFLNATEHASQTMPEAELPQLLLRRLQSYGGVIGEIRDCLSEESRILYRPLFELLLPRPWFKGRVVLIGDAAHATTPHLASGAGIAVEDSLVLSEELTKGDSVEGTLGRFVDRRFDRCRMVVNNSVRLGQLEQSGSTAEHAMLWEESMAAIAAPI